MKRAAFLFIILLLMLCNSLYSRHSASENNTGQRDSLKVLASPDLFNLTGKWAEEYNRLFPGANIKVVTAADEQKASVILKEGNMGFVSNNFYQGLKTAELWKVIVARDVIVTLINSKNPFLDEINQHGISPATLSSFLARKDSRTWGDLLKSRNSDKANFFCINDESAIKEVAQFLKTDETNLDGKSAGDAASVISAIQNDRYAIGFCKLFNVIDLEKNGMAENLKLLPIDRNENGILDNNEKIYNDVNDFTRGVWIGKYPKGLFSNIYTVAAVQPDEANEVAFIKWVLTDGQKYLSGNGFTELLLSERQSAADKLYNAKVYAGASAGEKTLLMAFMFIIATVILIGLIVNSAAKYRRRKESPVKVTGPAGHGILDENSLVIPNGIYFDKTHTWAFLEENGVVRVGIDDFLQHITGKITRIRMKDPGKNVKKGDQILSVIQNGKQLNLYSPVSGRIVEQNTALEYNASSLNSSPYKDGWIYKIEPSSWSRESQLLFMAEKQREFIKKEFSRLKDFLMTIQSGDQKYAQILLQDGGEISDGVMGEMGPEVWEDFQTGFIDPSRQVWFYEIF